ncbi:glycerate kinase [Shigella flexneri]
MVYCNGAIRADQRNALASCGNRHQYEIVIAPDSYKESLSASEVAQAIEKGFREIFPDAQYVSIPVANGGEGSRWKR